jgi:polysaccharide pyruvyl transferase WcaK-like protein
MRICLFNPAIKNNLGAPSLNLGDLIIEEAVKREINNIFQNCEILSISSHVYPNRNHVGLARNSSFIFVGGTNILGSRMEKYKQWKISFLQKLELSRAILIGVGWEQYQESPTWFTRISLKAVLSNNFLHSVRDSYSKNKLEEAGIKNVINTGCPTMWQLANLKSNDIQKDKSENALVMLTDYSKNPTLDAKLLSLISVHYKKIFIWPQGSGDHQYFKQLFTSTSNSNPIYFLEHSIKSFNSFLDSKVPFDYIGTRLHGGIKCLLAKRRSLILKIDNRATEIANDTNLPVAIRDDFEYIEKWIQGPSPTFLKIDNRSIELWKSQFNNN